ncbi:uncharacterized protein at5g41620 [Phtheirospermum japonicum]|uniref:Uncharacterized protein at5g41620 n=1 Tax=Phtheirospermum japonicum TaxID=374723 RepID=A0A830D3U4_9LAMI|nr:uncharacterized protein at5g41620 [Phtheirospermum japonicum]
MGSSTPVPKWKMTCSKSPSLENDGSLGGEKAKELNISVSARKLAATLWEIDGLSSARSKINEIGNVRKERSFFESSKLGSMALVLSDLSNSSVSEGMDLPKVGSHRRRASLGSQKIMQADCDLGGAKSIHDCLVEVDKTQNHARSPFRNLPGTKHRLKDVYNGLITSKELLRVMSRLSRFDQHDSTGLSLFSALKFELDRACTHITKLIQEQKTNRTEIDVLLKHFEDEKVRWKLKEQDRIRSAVVSIAGELDSERKLRRQTERLNKKLGRELAETNLSLTNANKELESEKRAREILEQVCDELARGIGDDRAEVEELKRQSAKVYEEVEKEREMLQLADILREERVQMKLSDAKYQFEEKNAVVDKLRDELEAYLKSKKGEERENGSPSYDKIKELEKYLRETLPCTYQYGDNEKNDIGIVNNNDEDDDDDDGDDDDDSADSDLHSIELNMDDVSKSFLWNSGEKIKKIKKPDFLCETRREDGVGWEFDKSGKGENLGVFEERGLFEFASQPWKKDMEDEIERYNMIKDLRDHIVSGSKMASSQDSASPNGQQSVSSKDRNGVVCEG